MWFEDIQSLIQIFVKGLVIFIALIFLLRVAGKRTLTKMNAFDFIMTFALGSTLSATILDEKITISEGMMAFLMLVGIQFVIAWFEVRSRLFQKLVKSTPTMVLYKGEIQREALKRERLSEIEVFAALRYHGLSSPSQAHAIVLETNGQLSVLPDSNKGENLDALIEAGINVPDPRTDA